MMPDSKQGMPMSLATWERIVERAEAGRLLLQRQLDLNKPRAIPAILDPVDDRVLEMLTEIKSELRELNHKLGMEKLGWSDMTVFRNKHPHLF